MTRKAIIIGHNSENGGFYSEHLKSNEFTLYTNIYERLRKIGAVYFHNANISSYKERMKHTADRINKREYDVVLALHFNAFHNPDVGGCEAWYYGQNPFGRYMAQRFCNATNELMGIRNRGAKSMRSPEQRGYWEVFYPRYTTVLLEPFFGSNKEDCERYNADKLIHILKNL